jgi:hypothetical protein
MRPADRPRAARNHRERKLVRALRGTDGYAAQQAAWDAVLPEWRYCLTLVNRPDRLRMSDKELADARALSAALNADGRFLARSWYQLLMQDLYRSCPALGGWFPE